jgi:hypothetical protein
MRTAIFTLCFIAIVSGNAQARLGESADQLVQRYGQPLSENDQKGEGDKIALADVVFQKGGIQINVTVVDGASVAETFKKINGQALSTSEIRILLNANAQGREWEAPEMLHGSKIWRRDDSATAVQAADGSLTIKSRELVAKETTAKKLEHAPSLEGF